jgi:hypothetical protein
MTDFSGLQRRNNIRPTDIDGSYDIDELFFCTLEGKYQSAELPIGQQRHFEAQMRLINAASTTDSRYFGVVLVYNHFTDCNDNIKPEHKEVCKIYDSINLKWITPENKVTVIDAIEEFEDIYSKRVFEYNKRQADKNAELARSRRN